MYANTQKMELGNHGFGLKLNHNFMAFNTEPSVLFQLCKSTEMYSVVLVVSGIV